MFEDVQLVTKCPVMFGMWYILYEIIGLLGRSN